MMLKLIKTKLIHLYLRKLRPRDIKQLAQSHPANFWQSQSHYFTLWREKGREKLQEQFDLSYLVFFHETLRKIKIKE